MVDASLNLKSRGWFPRYRLRAVLVAILLITTLLATYRIGFERGRRLGSLVPSDVSATTIYLREYDISDIVRSDAQADLIISSMRKKVSPDSWDVVGGYAEITYHPQTRSLRVQQVRSGHVGVVDYLSYLREAAADHGWASGGAESDFQQDDLAALLDSIELPTR